MKRNCCQIGVNFKGLDMRKTLIVLHTHTHTHTHVVLVRRKFQSVGRPRAAG